MVIRPGQLECVPGVRDGAVDVAAGLGDRGAIGRDRGREGPQLLVPGAIRLRRRTRDIRHCFRPNGLPRPFGIIEPHLGSIEIAFGEPRPGQEGGQQWAPSHNVVRQGAQPLPERTVLPVLAEVWQRELDQIGRAIEVIAGDRVDNSVGEQAVFGVPAAGGPVQPGHPVRVLGEEAGAECVSEQVVVAVPLALVVERDDEQVPALEDLQRLAAVVAAGKRVAQRSGQLREQRGVEEEPANIVGWLLSTSSTR